MATLPASRHDGGMSIAQRVGRALQGTACVVLLACVASRPFLAEMPFRTAPLKTVTVAGAQASQGLAGAVV